MWLSEYDALVSPDRKQSAADRRRLDALVKLARENGMTPRRFVEDAERKFRLTCETDVRGFLVGEPLAGKI